MSAQASSGTQPASPYHFCTYFDRNYLTRGLALYESLLRHCRRPFVLWVLCFDEETYATLVRLNLTEIRLISQQEFEAGDERLARTKETRSRVEYYWTCTPSLPLYALRQDPTIDLITYVDADLYFYSDPQPIYEEMGNASILIAEHRYAPEYERFARTAGTYNVGWMSFRRDGNGLACLNWWRERCLEWCYAYYEDGKFGDQLYLDDWPERFEGVAILEHKGAGLAPWNLARYQIAISGETITVDGAPLIFYHFHSFKWISRYTVQPAGFDYRIMAQQIRLLYLPYAYRLRDIQRSQAETAQVDLPADTVESVHSLLKQETFALAPTWLAVLLWRVGGWHHDAFDMQAAGFRAYAHGDLGAARANLLIAVGRNPLLLRNLGIISILLESLVGSGAMGRYRSWRHE